MLEFLVTRMGFTVFGIEATMPEGFDVNDYVLTGRGDPAKALSGLYFWTWDTKEVLDLIRWMRAWNADPTHQRKVKFYGFDMQFAPRAVKKTIEYLRDVDPAEASRMDEALASIANPYTAQRTGRLPAAQRVAIDSTVALLLNHFDARKTEYVRRSSPVAWAIARQHARIVSQYMAVYGPDGASVRDRAMAENIQWILQQEGPDAKMVVWAHNGHVSMAEPGMAANGMGHYLRAALGGDMVVFGFSFDHGSFQAGSGVIGGGLRSFEVGPAPVGSLDQTLAQAGLKIAAIDLRRLPAMGPVEEWFSRRHGTRSIGAVFTDSLAGQYIVRIAAPRNFDAILFVDSTTAAERNDRGQRPRGTVLAKPSNLDFEQGASGANPPDWTGPFGLARDRYHAEVTNDASVSGARCARIRSVPGRGYGESYGALSQSVEAASYQGKHVRLRASVRVAPAADGASAYLWLRVSGGGFGPGAEFLYEGMENRPIVSGEWREYTLEGDVPKGAVSINYGLALVGDGTAWLDNISLESVDP
jgi:erythromycin esterase